MQISLKTLEARVKSKSNYKGMNGNFYQVVEIAGKRVSVAHYIDFDKQPVIVDFTISEVVEFRDYKESE